MFSPNSKIVVVGTSGSGKSTLAQKLAEKIGLKRIELDALHWEANWIEAPPDVFRSRVVSAMADAENGWVIDGNYSKANTIIWPHADTIIWLDYPFATVFWRVLTRTIRRWIFREVLWAGNRESLYVSYFTKNSILLWVIQTYGRRVKQFTACMESDWKNHRVIRVRNYSDYRKFFAD